MSRLIVEKETLAVFKLYDGDPPESLTGERFIHIEIPEDIRGFHCDCYRVLDDLTLTLVDDELDRIESDKWIDIREKRDKLLKDSDWRMCRDIPEDTRWTDYRKQLRDLPSQYIRAVDVVFPLEPIQ